MMATTRYYDESKNPNGDYLAGVPMRNLTDEDWERLTDLQRADVDGSPYFRKTNPNPTPRAERAPDTKEEG